MKARILHLQRHYSSVGRGAIGCRALLGQLTGDGHDVRIALMVVSEEFKSAAYAGAKADLLTLSEVEAFDPHCVLVEDGLVEPGGTLPKAPEEWLVDFVNEGGVLVVDGISRFRRSGGESVEFKPATRAWDALMARTVTGEPPASRECPYLVDPISNDGRTSANIVWRPQNGPALKSWLEPTLDGIDSLLAAGALPLAVRGDALAWAENTAVALRLDREVDLGGLYCWAEVRQVGLGFVATLAAQVLGDTYVNANPDNARWVAKLIDVMVGAAGRERALRRPRPSPPARPAAISLAGLIAGGEGPRIEFKQTARVNLRTMQKDQEMEKAVIKTIAGFLNSTDGGTLLIGVADDGSVVGLEPDLQTVKRGDGDAFVNWLTTLVIDRLGSAAALKTQIGLERVDGVDVCRTVVHPAFAPVFVGDPSEFFVRMNNSTRSLSGPDLITYVKTRFA